MSSFWMHLRYWLMDYRVQLALVALAVGAVVYFGADTLLAAGGWLLTGIVALALIALVVVIVRKLRARKAARNLDGMVAEQGDQAVAGSRGAARADTEQLRERMDEAVKAIKSSRLGVMKGKAALYELPWYVIIGNPAAGKSTAILNSGLRFPFEDNRSNVIHGLGGTRNCDWYFTTEGIVLDTAGRYTVSAEDRLEWLTFLDLLRKNRPRAPINGIIIAASIAELSGSKPEFAIELAKNLRQRVQELTERLEVHAPVYVVFTKADLIAGFSDFFRGLDPSERENVWGATLPYVVDASDPAADALGAFDTRFDELADGLREMGLAQMAMARGHDVAPGLITLPLEFAAIKPALRTFIATLFEENPYQFKPVFRGFYFTSALQEGAGVHHASARVTRQFALTAGDATGEPAPPSESSHFLLGLFRKVIFADRQLVRQYSSPTRTRLRYVAFGAAMLALALVLAGWTWSYTGNQQLVANVEADLEQAIELQRDRLDLQSRVEALLVLQDRLQQLGGYRDDPPLGLGLGLYQGEALEAKLRAEYFHGMRQIMLAPVTAKLEGYLAEVVARRAQLRPPGLADAGTGAEAPAVEAPAVEAPAAEALYQDASPTDAQDAYNALKTYLMLGHPERVETAHLADQLTRFWRGWLEANRGAMSREEMLRAAGRLMSFYVSQSGQAGWPRIEPRFSLVDDSRQALRKVMKGTPARDRVYAQIKARAATRFPAVTVASVLGNDALGNDVRGDGTQAGVLGSEQVSGAFTVDAWSEYVRDAIQEAANTELSSTDWVLDATVQNDLTLAGSPEHIAKELTALYKADYAREWRRFLRGVSVADFGSFGQAVARMNNLGDPRNSPLRTLLRAVNRQTVWDNPGAGRAEGEDGGGFMDWFRRVILRRTPSSVDTVANSAATGDIEDGAEPAMGPIGREFAGLARLLADRGDEPPLLHAYFEALGAIRTRLNAIRTLGDPGPGARELMQQTLEGEESELAAALQLVDERMLNGLDADQREVLRPLLLRPLMQSFAALVGPAEGEINRIWSAQVYKPFQAGIAARYPFVADATVEATTADIARIFGPEGAIARFQADALGALVVRRGNTLTARRWADIGINLKPVLIGNYANWVAPLGDTGGTTTGARGSQKTYVFQILPLPGHGISEYTIELDGQRMRYRNTPPQWHTFTWPNPEGLPGVHISGVAGDGRGIDLLNVPGRDGMMQLFSTARQKQLGKNHHRLTWTENGASVAVELRIVSVTEAGSGNSAGLVGLQLPAAVAGATPVASRTADTGGGGGATDTGVNR